MAKTDDFTFQITTTPLPCLVDSPPMWRPSSSSEISTFEREEVLISTSEISTCEREEVLISCVELGISDEDEEEKMDMLWEDLNEKFSEKCGSNLNIGDSPGRFVKFGCIRGNAIVKKPRKVSFLKVLKSLFLLHNFQLKLKKRNCDPKLRV